MTKFRKFALAFCLVLMLTLAFMLCACGDDQEADTGANTNTSTEANTDTSTDTSTDEQANTCTHSVLAPLPKVEPTCTNTGLTQGYFCLDCDKQ